MHPVHVFTLPGTSSGTQVEMAYFPAGLPPAPVVARSRPSSPKRQAVSSLALPHDRLHAPWSPSPNQPLAPSPQPNASRRPTAPDSTSRHRLVGFRGCADRPHHLFPQPRPRSLRPAPRRPGGCRCGRHHRPQRQSFRTRRSTYFGVWDRIERDWHPENLDISPGDQGRYPNRQRPGAAFSLRTGLGHQ